MKKILLMVVACFGFGILGSNVFAQKDLEIPGADELFRNLQMGNCEKAFKQVRDNPALFGAKNSGRRTGGIRVGLTPIGFIESSHSHNKICKPRLEEALRATIAEDYYNCLISLDPESSMKMANVVSSISAIVQNDLLREAALGWSCRGIRDRESVDGQSHTVARAIIAMDKTGPSNIDMTKVTTVMEK